MYKEGFIGVVKVDGKIMRELNGVIQLPFGSEYAILLKNKESRKAVVTVEIDGKDALSGQKLVINSNQEMELEGFLDGMLVRNRFKFIQKTKEIQDFRGDRIDDGLIRIGVRYELPVVDKTIVHENHIYHDYYHRWLYPSPWWHRNDVWYGAGGGLGSGCGGGGGATAPLTTCNLGSNVTCNMTQVNNAPTQDEGITVKGSEVNQNFTSVYTKQLEEQEKVIIIVLKGCTETGVKIEQPVTVELIYQCSSCGKKHSYAARFCSNCGTYLS